MTWSTWAPAPRRDDFTELAFLAICPDCDADVTVTEVPT